MEELTCGICGNGIDDEYKHSLPCNPNHTFHYNCLVLSFKNTKGPNECPYCRVKCGVLPLVNGIKNPIIGIHDTSNVINYVNKGCKYILTRGKNKGSPCNLNCKLGYEYCKRHIKNTPKDN